jgi:hypothetical protein
MMVSYAMTVQELRDALAGYDPDTPVHFVERMGKQTALPPVSDVTPRTMAYDDNLNLFVDAPHAKQPVIILE